MINKKTFYNLGLWCGDKYVFGGSVGLTNTSKELIKEFRDFLEVIVFDKTTIKEKSINDGKASRIYVNSWLLLRVLMALQEKRKNLIKTENDFLSYITGRIDADGTIMPYNIKSKSGLIKITYGKKEEAEKDLEIMKKFCLRGCILNYKDRNAFDLKLTYLSSLEIIHKLPLKNSKKMEKINLIGKLAGR